MNTVIWLGPVSTANISSAVPHSWDIRTYNRGANNGIGSSAFREWSETLGNDPISALAPGASEVILASFSAGHGATEVILQKVATNDDDRLRAFLSCDSYYVSTTNTTPKPGHVAWLREIIRKDDGRKALFTTSSYDGPGYLSARDSFEMLSRNIHMELRDYQSVAPWMPEPYLCHANGPVVWLNYENTFSHVEHATKLASITLDGWFRGGPMFPKPASGGVGVLALLGLLYAAFSKSRSR